MVKPTRFFIFFLLITCCTATIVLAGSLDKYGSESSYVAPPSPKVSPREIAITKAVQAIRDAGPQRREKIIAAYRSRAKIAMENNRFDEAKFYTEILSRSGN